MAWCRRSSEVTASGATGSRGLSLVAMGAERKTRPWGLTSFFSAAIASDRDGVVQAFERGDGERGHGIEGVVAGGDGGREKDEAVGIDVFLFGGDRFRSGWRGAGVRAR